MKVIVMNEKDMEIFNSIREKSKKDREFWDEAQSQEYPVKIPDKVEEEIIERMFLVYYVERYLELFEER